MFYILKKVLNKLGLVKESKYFAIVLCGSPNVGKTLLANKICKEWTGEEPGSVSSIPHETKEVEAHNSIIIESARKKISLSIVDTPGLATRIDYEDFMKHGLPERKAKERAKKATEGVIDSIRTIQEAGAVLVVIDSTQDPNSQVNLTIVANLTAKKIPTIIVANKIDLKRGNIDSVVEAFPEHKVMGVSAKRGDNLGQLYAEMVKLAN